MTQRLPPSEPLLSARVIQRRVRRRNFAMCTPLACSDYYGASAPPHGHRSTTDLPATGPAARRGGRPGTVPTFTRNRSMREAPALTPTASPRLRRRPSAWPPHRTHKPATELIPTTALTRSGADHALHTGPYPSGLSRFWTYGASDSGSSRTPSHHCLPDPDRLTVPTRPVRCQGCSHRRVRSHASAAPSFTGQLRLTGGEVVTPPLDSRRLVAHCGVPEVGLRRDLWRSA